MRFFSSLIVLVPLVFSVVALPASTQDVSTITSGITGIGKGLNDAAGDLQSFTDYSATQAKQVEDDLARLTSDLAKLTAYIKQTYPLLQPFDKDDAQTILNSLGAALPLLIKLQELLTGAAPDFFHKLGLFAFGNLGNFVRDFGGAFGGTTLAIVSRVPSDSTIDGGLLSAAISEQLGKLNVAYTVPLGAL